MSTMNPPSTGSRALPGLMWIALCGFSGFFLTYATTVPIALERGLSSAAGGTLLVVMMVAVIAVQPAAPALQRLLGPRRAIGGALALMAAGHGAAVLVPGAAAGLLAAGVMVGMGFGILVVLATAAVPAVVRPERTGRALGLFGATTSAAAALGAPLGLWLSAQVPPGTFRLTAAAAILLALAALPGVRSRSAAPGDAAALAARGPGRPAGAADLPAGATPVPDGDPPGADRPSDAASAGEKTRRGARRPSGAVPVPDGESPGARRPSGAAVTGRDERPGAARASGSLRSALVPVLLPFLVAMAAYGLVIAFGPGPGAAQPALAIATMQVASVLGRWAAGVLTDRSDPRAVYTVGIAMAALGLIAVALGPAGWVLAACLVLMGLGVGTVQSASLVMSFARARSRGRASVGWNMSFDAGLGLAGVFGGLGFTHLGAGPTFMVVAGVLLVAGIPLWARRR